ncbi:MAG: STAS domain-containing protein [candidate division KSB1 bacterium]|nr:STAS domain-containing protein [candidate division KSB1 bacterium]
MEGIEITSRQVGALRDVVLFETGGYIDTNTSPELQKRLDQTIERGNYQLVIDLSDVKYVSSAGWGVFVSEINRVKEKGGDLKLAAMNPEVQEVFEMLEFHRILSAYEFPDEAILDFDFYRDVLAADGQPISVPKPEKQMVHLEKEEESPVYETPLPPLEVRHYSPRFPMTNGNADEKRMPLNEKIKRIVLENPMLGLWGIRKMLFSPRFGFCKVGLFELHKILKSLNLHTKAKRFRFYRSR